MSLQQYVRQVRPRNESYTPPVDKVQNFLHEAKGTGTDFSIWLDDEKHLDKWYKATKPSYPKAHIKKLMKYLKNEGLAATPVFAGERTTPKIKIRKIEKQDQDTIRDWMKTEKLKITDFKFANGAPKEGTPDPKGADWESLITDKYNEIVGGTDKNASTTALKFYPEYGDAASRVATSFNKKLKMTTAMKQYGGGGGKSNLSSSWLEWGGTNGTPKTDMYTSKYNISLKKAGGSQLASGGKGETISTFYAALEYMGEDRSANKDIDDIMSMIEGNFAKIRNKDLTAGLADDIATGKKPIGKIPRADIEKYETTEKFHKELNKEITKKLGFDKNPIFRKWYTFEAMSGYKKFGNQQSIASICVEFNADTGVITKSIPVTSDGKSSFGVPSVSSEVESISKKLKIFSAWKTGAGSPASVLRAIPEESDTFRGIILNELCNDKVANKVMTNLHEEIEQLDEFTIMRNVFNKVKSLTSKAKAWLNNLFVKIMKRVKSALEKIKQMGAKMFEKLFEFFNIVITSVAESFPRNLHGFIYGMTE